VLTLLEMWQERSSNLITERDALLLQCTAAAAGATSEQDKRLAELVAVQRLIKLNVAVFSVAMAGSVMSATQYSTYALSALPWVPSLPTLLGTLRIMRERGAGGGNQGSASAERRAASGVFVAEAARHNHSQRARGRAGE